MALNVSVEELVGMLKLDKHELEDLLALIPGERPYRTGIQHKHYCRLWDLGLVAICKGSEPTSPFIASLTGTGRFIATTLREIL